MATVCVTDVSAAEIEDHSGGCEDRIRWDGWRTRRLSDEPFGSSFEDLVRPPSARWARPVRPRA